MKYVRVEDGQVVEGPMQLPTCWRNISGLDMASEDYLKGLGWLPIETVEPTIGPGQVRASKTYIIGADKVTCSWGVRNCTDDENTRFDHAAKIQDIAALEKSVTPRRMREATLTADGEAWLKGIEDQIIAIRASLPVLPVDEMP